MRFTKVALLRPCRIGDFLCATPAIRAMKAAMPEAEFSFIGLPCVEDMVARSPHLDRFIFFPGYPGVADHVLEPREALRFFAQMQEEGFDLAVQMYGNGVHSNPVAMMLGAKRTVGFIRNEDTPGHLSQAVRFPVEGHEVDRLLTLAEAIGASPRGRDTEFPLWDEDRLAASSLLEGLPEPFIGLAPGARYGIRRWSVRNFAEAGRLLRSRLGGTLVIVGGPGDETLAASIAARTEGSCVNATGALPVATLGAVIARLRILIANDSGPAHIAYALNTPTITVWGGAVLSNWGPPERLPFKAIIREAPCRPCWQAECPIGHPCMELITPEEVAKEAFGVL